MHADADTPADAQTAGHATHTNRSLMLSAVLLERSANASFFCSRPSLIFSLFSRHLSARAARAACQGSARARQTTAPGWREPSPAPRAGLLMRQRAGDQRCGSWGPEGPERRQTHLAGLVALCELLVDGRARRALLGGELFEALLHGRFGSRGGRLDVDLKGDGGHGRHRGTFALSTVCGDPGARVILMARTLARTRAGRRARAHATGRAFAGPRGIKFEYSFGTGCGAAGARATKMVGTGAHWCMQPDLRTLAAAWRLCARAERRAAPPTPRTSPIFSLIRTNPRKPSFEDWTLKTSRTDLKRGKNHCFCFFIGAVTKNGTALSAWRRPRVGTGGRQLSRRRQRAAAATHKTTRRRSRAGGRRRGRVGLGRTSAMGSRTRSGTLPRHIRDAVPDRLRRRLRRRIAASAEPKSASNVDALAHAENDVAALATAKTTQRTCRRKRLKAHGQVLRPS